ncbi:MAG TPA: DUF4424 domain-containing protein [Mesorhizobium sp.]|nr:DUF4424 domain-containing protein [Mesorhizobium sp.]
MIRRALPILAALAASPAWTPAWANDSIAELGAGGLVLSRSDAVAMESEDLFISTGEVRVDYRFRNVTDRDVEAIVAFPMPDLLGSPFEIPSLPVEAQDNFLDFEVEIDGKPVEPSLENRAFAAELDATDDLRAAGVSFFPFGDAAFEALAELPGKVAEDWVRRGLITIDTYDDGSGWKDVRTPIWRLKSTYWWPARFPAGKAVMVSHRYRPSVGMSVGTGLIGDPAAVAEYERRFCVDAAFRRAVEKAQKTSGEGGLPFSEMRLRYVLTTGGNWAFGTIGRFRLVVDKGAPENLVSFCGRNVKKTGPTTFEMAAEDFYPERDLEILILQPAESGRGASPEPARKRRQVRRP